ncbi:MAG: hypothetical protein ACSHWZ_19220 [Sulfitobacter sp.]
MTDIHDIFERANEIYAATRVIDDAHAPADSVGIAEIYRGLTNPDQAITNELSRALFASPALRSVFQTVQGRFAVATMPAMAAASDRKLVERQIDGGSARLTPSKRGDQMYLTLQMGSDLPAVPLVLIMVSEVDETIVKRLLPAPDETGELLVVLDRADTVDAAFIAALEDPRFVGTFVKSTPQST